jgi:lysozyme
MAIMQLSDEGKQLIKSFEGLRLEAYQCSAGVWTIGYGHTGALSRIDGDNGKVRQGDTITRAQADFYFDGDTAKFEAAVNAAAIPNLNQNQFDALVSLCYNIGEAAFNGSTLLRLAKVNAQDGRIRYELLRWASASGRPNEGLRKRREKEAELYFKK